MYILETPRLGSIPIHRDILSLERLHDKVGHHTAVGGVHTWAISVEDAHDADGDGVLAGEGVGEGFGYALALVVAGAWADGVDVPPVVFRLRMDFWVTVHL